MSISQLAQVIPGVTKGLIYTAPAGNGVIVLNAVIANPSPAAVPVTIDRAPGGAISTSPGKALLAAVDVPARQSLILKLLVPLAVGDALAAACGPIAPPSLVTPVALTTGGTLAANTYFYVVTAVSATGETLPSGEVQVTTTGSTSSVPLSITQVPGATNYKIYRGTATGAETLLTTVAAVASTSPGVQPQVTFTDIGGAVSGALPTSPTATAVTISLAGLVL